MKYKDSNSPLSCKILVQSASNSEEKLRLVDAYNRLDKNKLMDVYKNKNYLHIENEYHRDIGATYIQPIILKGEVEAILVIEFSLEEETIITNELEALGDIVQFVALFFIQVFLSLIWFSYMDLKREKEKNKAFRDLKELNNTLQNRIDIEIEKNRAQTVQMLHQSRLAQIGEMISMIAHQWRQPLSAISATSAAINLKFQKMVRGLVFICQKQ
ncbi:MAG: hypothetical protein U9N02_05010 [Campylobacterota bacterium]|nr:hypothetical protein [Campylobacterota bacterium]